MKTRLIALSLLVIFTASVISGCASASAMQLSTPTQHPSKAETADVVRTLNEPNPEKETAPEAVTPRITVPETDTIEVQQNESKSAPATPADQTHLSSGYLTQEEAIAIALNDAGLSKDQVSRLKAEFDIDDGVPQYDVEFKYDGWEYEYEIHAESGEILKWDKDRDD